MSDLMRQEIAETTAARRHPKHDVISRRKRICQYRLCEICRSRTPMQAYAPEIPVRHAFQMFPFGF